jgi:hypothetical protein
VDLGPLAEPRAEPPRLFGAPHAGEPGVWADARARLDSSRNVWLSAVDRGRPHSRPVWAVWLVEGLAFSTGSPALQRGSDGGQVAATTESGDEPVILEGTGRRVTDRDVLDRFVTALNAKYGWSARATDEGMTDEHGNAGPVFVLRPDVAFAWRSDMAAATRFRFST